MKFKTRIVSTLLICLDFDQKLNKGENKLTEGGQSFEGADGYNPVKKGSRVDSLPAPGSSACLGGLEPESRDLEWDSSLSISGCAFVKNAATLIVLPR